PGWSTTRHTSDPAGSARVAHRARHSSTPRHSRAYESRCPDDTTAVRSGCRVTTSRTRATTGQVAAATIRLAEARRGRALSQRLGQFAERPGLEDVLDAAGHTQLVRQAGGELERRDRVEP